MGAWMLPSAAAAFAVGLLGGTAMPAWTEPWMAFAAGVGALGSGWIVAGRGRRGPGALTRAHLLPPDHATIEAVASGRVSAVAPVAAAVLSVVASSPSGPDGVGSTNAAWTERSSRLSPPSAW